MHWETMDEPYDVEFETGIVVDLDYEFDAPKLYDFTREETGSEVQDAEAWFGSAQEYPSSPVAIKWNWNANVHVEDPATSARSCKDSAKGVKSGIDGPNSPVKASPRKSSNFMNPTASHLAKQHNSPGVLCDRLLRRFERLSFRGEKSLRHSLSDTRATKRQKLEVGYLLKGAMLDTKFAVSKPPKLTTPREPNLVTAHRAERRRSKMNPESADPKESNLPNLRERPANRKNLEASSVPLPKRSSQQLFQAVDSGDANADSRNGVERSKRATADAASVEFGGSKNVQARCLSKKEINYPVDKFHDEPACESLSKLSLSSEASVSKSLRKTKGKSKGLKENAPACLNTNHEMRSLPESKRHPIQYYECRRNGQTASSLSQISIGRTLDIR